MLSKDTLSFCRNLVSDPSFRWKYLLDLKVRYRGLMGYFSNYISEEVIAAAGFHPVRIIGSISDSENSPRFLYTPVCSFARDVFAAACSGEFSMLSGVIFPNSCDSLKVLRQMWRHTVEQPHLYTLLHPVNTGDIAVTYSADRIRDLADYLQSLAGTPFSTEDLKNTVEKFNQIRRLLRDLYAIRQRNPAFLKGSDAVALMTAGLMMERDEYLTILTRLIQTVQDKIQMEGRQKRIMIIGPLMDQLGLLETIEQCGGSIVYEEITNGARYCDTDVETEGDLYENLAKRYLKAGPSPTLNNPKAVEAEVFRKRVSELNLQGVICINQKFCEPHIHNYLMKKDLLRQMNIPTLMLEVEHGRQAVQQRVTLRIESFLETIGDAI